MFSLVSLSAESGLIKMHRMHIFRNSTESEKLIIQQGDWSHGLIKYEGFWPGGGDPECEISVRSGSHQTGRSLTFRRPRGTETSALLMAWASFHWFHLWNTTGDVCFPSCSPRACEDHSPCVTRACETSTFVFDRRNKECPQWSVCCWWLLMRFLSILQLFTGQSYGEETECLWDVIGSLTEVSPSLILDWKSKTYSCRTASTLILVYFILILSVSHQTFLCCLKLNSFSLWRVSSCRNTRVKFWSADPSCLTDIFKRWCYSCEIKSSSETRISSVGFQTWPLYFSSNRQ